MRFYEIPIWIYICFAVGLTLVVLGFTWIICLLFPQSQIVIIIFELGVSIGFISRGLIK